MRMGPIVHAIKTAKTDFGNYVAGAAELETVRESSGITRDLAFVIPINDVPADPNKNDSVIEQTVIEKFAVVVILKNDNKQDDKFGFAANDRLHGIRSQLFRALLGKEYYQGSGIIEYAGGQLLPLNPAWLWYQFDFQYPALLRTFSSTDNSGEEQVGGVYVDIEGSDLAAEDTLRAPLSELEAPSLDQIYTQYILSPDENIPNTDELPVSSAITDMEQNVDRSMDPTEGGYNRGFSSGYDFWKILNRRDDPK